VKKITLPIAMLLLLCSHASYANKDSDQFVEDVLMHVVLHEIGHALIREFDLPILGNEETMGDAFAATLAELVSMSESDINQATDYGTEIHRSWRRILQPLAMPGDMVTNEARVIYDGDSEPLVKLSKGSLYKTLKEVLIRYDWHSQVTLSFVEGDRGASYSRNGRTIKVHSGYVKRFAQQATSKCRLSGYRQNALAGQNNPNIILLFFAISTLCTGHCS